MIVRFLLLYKRKEKKVKVGMDKVKLLIETGSPWGLSSDVLIKYIECRYKIETRGLSGDLYTCIGRKKTKGKIRMDKELTSSC